ncbi:MAG: hypothetical protein ABIP55_09155 [Tepidisphaeraceae bacterium]
MTTELLDIETIYSGWVRLLRAKLRSPDGEVIEREIILDHNTKFRVSGVKKSGEVGDYGANFYELERDAITSNRRASPTARSRASGNLAGLDSHLWFPAFAGTSGNFNLNSSCSRSLSE